MKDRQLLTVLDKWCYRLRLYQKEQGFKTQADSGRGPWFLSPSLGGNNNYPEQLYKLKKCPVISADVLVRRFNL